MIEECLVLFLIMWIGCGVSESDDQTREEG